MYRHIEYLYHFQDTHTYVYRQNVYNSGLPHGRLNVGLNLRSGTSPFPIRENLGRSSQTSQASLEHVRIVGLHSSNWDLAFFVFS